MPAMDRETVEPKIYRVAELTRRIKAVLEDELGEVWIEGEISNARQPASGHWYFTLKDESAQIAAVLFRGQLRGARVAPRDGLLVRAFGLVSVYEKSGQYQVLVRRLEPAGQGALQAAFEALKRKLQAEGLFDPARKRPLPLLPQHIGIVTSPTGAALRDLLQILGRRYPNLHLVLAPVRVQGPGAAEDIAAAIADLNALGGLDALIVGRGGGSLEDLWAFNEECVARAIARSAIPVVSAVGHETDFTIADFAADLRAPTPSAAAELVIGRKADFEEALRGRRRRLAQALTERLLTLKNRFLAAGRSPVFREPRHMVRRQLERLGRLHMQLAHGARGAWRENRQCLDDLAPRLARGPREWRRLRALELQRWHAQLQAVNPLAVLKRGYSITTDTAGRALISPAALQPGATVRTRLAAGAFDSEVTRIHDHETRG